MFPLMEGKLLEYVKEICAKGIALHQTVVRNEARRLIKDLYLDAPFKAFTDWCHKFIKINNLVDWRITRLVYFTDQTLITT